MPSELVKIGYVLKRFPRLSETFILNELLELERLGAALQIYSMVDPAVIEPDGVRHALLRELATPVTYLPRKPALKGLVIKRGQFNQGAFAEEAWKIKTAAFLQAAAVANLAAAQGVTHLHAHFATDAATVAMLASRLTGLAFSFTAHAKDIFHQQVDRALLRQKIQEARFVVTVSEFNRQYLVDFAGAEFAPKIVRLYNGINLERFKPDPQSHREPDLILSVGRLEEKKGFGRLLEACRTLQAAGRSFRCLIVGEGPEREALQRQISALDLAERVVLNGALPQEQLIETMKRATVFVLPCVTSATGDQDGLPTVL
ncbi:MAG: colanic acid biosynthesis glycosyltransferase WcaL, partial [Verrucomicrobia bacterium]